MSINEDLEAKILRYYHVEKWRIGRGFYCGGC